MMRSIMCCMCLRKQEVAKKTFTILKIYPKVRYPMSNISWLKYIKSNFWNIMHFVTSVFPICLWVLVKRKYTMCGVKHGNLILVPPLVCNVVLHKLFKDPLFFLGHLDGSDHDPGVLVLGSSPPAGSLISRESASLSPSGPPPCL